MELRREVLVRKNVDHVWELLGSQFGDAYKWASTLLHSEARGAPHKNPASYSNRTCETTQGSITEVVNLFDPHKHVLEYEVTEGFPSFIALGRNHWSLSPVDGGTLVRMHLTLTTKGLLGVVMNPMVRMQMGKLTTTVINDFKHYAETGMPSPTKAKEIAKYAKRAA